MKNIHIILWMFLLAGCAQDMGHYVTLSPKGHCKIVILAPNENDIDDSIYKHLVAWTQRELPRLGYLVLNPHKDYIPPAHGEVVLHYSTQFLPSQDASAALSRYQLTLEIRDSKTQENFFRISTEMESSETNQQIILSNMENALYSKFLQTQGPESQVETKTTSKILHA